MEIGNIRVIQPTESIIKSAGFDLKMDDFMLCATVDLNPSAKNNSSLCLTDYYYHIIKLKNQEYLLRLIHEIEDDAILISCNTIPGSYTSLKLDEIDAVFWMIRVFN